MSAIDMVIDICNIMVASNLQVSKIIQENGFNPSIISKHFRNTAKEFKKYSKIIESHGSLSTKPRCKEEEGAQNNDEEYDKLIDRIEKIKQDRQNDKENDKKWKWMMKVRN